MKTLKRSEIKMLFGGKHAPASCSQNCPDGTTIDCNEGDTCWKDTTSTGFLYCSWSNNGQPGAGKQCPTKGIE